MRFVVSFEGKKRSVQLVFGRPVDIPALMGWRVTAETRSNPHVRDALEFRKLATKRWRYYFRSNEAATSLLHLQRAIRSDRFAEVGFLVLAKARWHPESILGCCFCRRSWCHHLIVDFLAVHPGALAGACGRVRGVGTGIIYALVGLAEQLRIDTIWGEATRSSAPFYEKVLNLPAVTDHFFLHGETFERCRHQYRIMH